MLWRLLSEKNEAGEHHPRYSLPWGRLAFQNKLILIFEMRFIGNAIAAKPAFGIGCHFVNTLRPRGLLRNSPGNFCEAWLLVAHHEIHMVLIMIAHIRGISPNPRWWVVCNHFCNLIDIWKSLLDQIWILLFFRMKVREPKSHMFSALSTSRSKEECLVFSRFKRVSSSEVEGHLRLFTPIKTIVSNIVFQKHHHIPVRYLKSCFLHIRYIVIWMEG